MNQPSMPLVLCDQCGLMHPPLPKGEKCPAAKNAIKNEDGTFVDFEVYFNDLKNIIFSQIHNKNVKNYDLLSKKLIINITKFLESYEET